MSPAERMAAIFIGNQQAHYVADFEHAVTDAKTGKVKPEYVVRNRPATLADFGAHLRGELCLLIVPVDQDGMCRFGAIDLDDYKADLTALLALIRKHDLPLSMEMSKSGGVHLVWYLLRAMLAKEMRERLADFVSLLDLPVNVEIFPKQDSLDPGDIGTGINLSYFGGDSATNYAIDRDGKQTGGRRMAGPYRDDAKCRAAIGSKRHGGKSRHDSRQALDPQSPRVVSARAGHDAQQRC
jgi:hypothetical protein